MSGLSLLAGKQPIVSTYGADSLRDDAGAVQDAYDWHAATYVEPPPLADLRRAFTTAVRSSDTPKGCLVAPFGYGKTASAIGIWRACQKEGLLAVPPVSCGSFTELASAIRDWLTFALPEHAGRIDAAHERFLEMSAEVLARRDEREFGIPFDQAHAAIRDKLERGYLDFEDVSLNLLAFLERATTLALEAGYGGLTVLIDEFQQLLGNATKGTLVALRQLVWGLRTRKLPFGLLITMDPDTERTLADRAGDILHRIKDDGLYLNLQRVYDREFPARLWHQYGAVLGLNDREREAIDRAALDALGQLCERDDLSNGPRMVINALQLAAARGETPATGPYTPLNLIDDLLSGAIQFDGDRSILPTLLGELLNFPYFERSQSLAAALKLLAAFPRGCPQEVARRYGLSEAWTRLGDELRGEIVTELDEGLTLVELQRVGRPANRLNSLLRRYWMQVTDLQLFAEDAPRSFAEVVLPLLFPPKKHDLSGWAGLEDVQLSPEGAYRGVIEGTSSPRFPLRRVAVRVVSEPIDEADIPDDVDFSLLFRLTLEPKAESKVWVSLHKACVEVTLALGRTAEDGLRGGLAWIEHYLSPQPITPALVLSLLRYLAREGGGGASARDQARVEDTVARLQAWLLAEMLPPSAFGADGFSVIQAGQAGLQELLFDLGSHRWPNYHPLALHQHWVRLLADYEAALGRIPPAARVGVMPFIETKAHIAAVLGQARHAGFESRAKLYGELLRIDRWSGDEAAVAFLPHAAELRLATAVREAGRMAHDDAYRLLRSAGYAAPEARVLISLARLRGLVSEKDHALMVPSLPSPVELADRAVTLKARVARLGAIQHSPAPHLTALEEALAKGTEPGELAWRLEQIEQSLSEAERELQEATRARAEALRRELLEALPLLRPVRRAEILPELAQHIGALHARLEHERQALEGAASEALTMNAPHSDQVSSIVNGTRAWHGKAGLAERWTALAERIDRLKLALLRLDGDGPALTSLRVEVAGLARKARAVLSRIGVAGLPEVSRLEPMIGNLEDRFRLCEDERTRAYERVAASLAREIQATMDLTAAPSFPPYDPGDDEGSFLQLGRGAANSAARAIALWSLELTNSGAGKGEALARSKLRADIRSAARHARDETWLLTGPRVGLSKEAARTLKALHRRLAAQETDAGRWEGYRRLADALAALPPGPTDVALLLQSANGSIQQDGLLEELVRLHQTGAIRLLVDLPADR